MNACVVSFSALLILCKSIQRFDAYGNFIYGASFQERNQTVISFEVMTLPLFREKSRQ